MAHAIEAILFDLDGTLLENDIDVFVSHYFQRFAARMSSILPPRKFLDSLMQATSTMMANDGRLSNEEVFAAAFFPLVGLSRQELEPVFADFYAHDFAALRRYTRRRPEARPAVQAAFDRGCDVVIATNPLFPATAIEQRLEWAGVADFPYRLVTTYENSRACKPNLLYYAQILETIGRPAVGCLMVGDEAMDMVAARLGYATFLVAGPATRLDPDTPAPTYQGTLADVERLLRGETPLSTVPS